MLATEELDIIEVSNNGRELFMHEAVENNSTLLHVHLTEL